MHIIAIKKIRIHSILLIVGLLAAICSSYGQVSGIIILKNIRIRLDSTSKNILISSLNGFLGEKNKSNLDNSYIMNGYKLETSAWLDEINGIEISKLYKINDFFKCYLTNVINNNDSSLLIQFSFIGMNENIPLLRANFKILAYKKGDRYLFYSPLKQNTVTWQRKRIGNITFHYKMKINLKQAKEYQHMVHNYDMKIVDNEQYVDFYSCDNFNEALNLIGVEFKSDYNGNSYNSLSSYYNNFSLFVNGTSNKDGFNKIDPHDLWHDRLHNIISVDIINRPVDEGCAYLFGGSWGISWIYILNKFKQYAALNPKADWVTLYNTSYNFGEANNPPLNVDFVINALIIKKTEKEKGFNPIRELLSCGKYISGNENYFLELQKVTGITKDKFNDAIWELLRSN